VAHIGSTADFATGTIIALGTPLREKIEMTSEPGCAFCGRSGIKMSREHVFPQWLSRAASGDGNYTWIREGRGITTPLIEVVTKRVCEECNTGWLSRIEAGAKAVLEPLLNASTNRITEADRWIIARWFTKTILTAQLALVPRSGTGIVDGQAYRDFYENPSPFNNSVIFISGYHGLLLPIAFDVVPLPGDGAWGFRVFFHFHRLVLTGFVAGPGKDCKISWPHNFHTACHLIWPPQRGFMGYFGDPTLPCSWPPPYLLDQTVIELFLSTLWEGQGRK
jgi:hypothetical protein